MSSIQLASVSLLVHRSKVEERAACVEHHMGCTHKHSACLPFPLLEMNCYLCYEFLEIPTDLKLHEVKNGNIFYHSLKNADYWSSKINLSQLSEKFFPGLATSAFMPISIMSSAQCPEKQSPSWQASVI